MDHFSSLLRSRILNDPYYRFQSTQELQVAAELGIRIDINQASVDDWLRLPGLSIHQARMLVQLTDSGLQFHCLEDLAAALGMPIQRLKPWEPILRFCYYNSDSLLDKVNPNTASVAELMKVPDFTAELATRIVRQREHNPYRNLADFQQRLSLPATLIAQVMHYLRFSVQ